MDHRYKDEPVLKDSMLVGNVRVLIDRCGCEIVEALRLFVDTELKEEHATTKTFLILPEEHKK